jgi:hypothetical protein
VVFTDDGEYSSDHLGASTPLKGRDLMPGL